MLPSHLCFSSGQIKLKWIFSAASVMPWGNSWFKTQANRNQIVRETHITSLCILIQIKIYGVNWQMILLQKTLQFWLLFSLYMLQAWQQRGHLKCCEIDEGFELHSWQAPPSATHIKPNTPLRTKSPKHNYNFTDKRHETQKNTNQILLIGIWVIGWVDSVQI